jgi:hypothetical protein
MTAPRYRLTVYTAGQAVTRADLERAIKAMRARWGEDAILSAEIVRARRKKISSDT